MVENDPYEDWLDKDENEKYELFYIKYCKPIIFKGWNPDAASRDAPEGFTEWLKSNKRTVK